MWKIIDNRLLKTAAIFVGYLVCLLPVYLIVGWLNSNFEFKIRYETVSFLLLIVAIVLSGNVYRDAGRKDS